MVEQSNREVTKKVGNEERPIILRHRRRGEINIVDDVNPHVARVVSQVFAKFLCRIRKKSIPVRCIESRSDGNLALDTDFIKVREACVILQSFLFVRTL